jgi:hypothetical protein
VGWLFEHFDGFKFISFVDFMLMPQSSLRALLAWCSGRLQLVSAEARATNE